MIGELVGFVPPAMAGATLVALGASEVLLVLGLVGAGLIEGAVLGFSTGRVLHRYRPDIAVAPWVGATALGAGIAWLAGMGGSSLVQAVGPWVWALVGPGLVVGLLALGTLQWRVLRTVVPHSARWVPVTSGAWLLGVTIPVVALSVVPNSAPLAVHVLVGVAAAVAMGATVGLLTGRTMARLIRP